MQGIRRARTINKWPLGVNVLQQWRTYGSNERMCSCGKMIGEAIGSKAIAPVDRLHDLKAAERQWCQNYRLGAKHNTTR